MSMIQRYRNYMSLVRRERFKVRCPSCNDFQSRPHEMEKHLGRRHCSSSNICCRWCLGTYTWELNQKMQQVEHMAKCFKEFVKLNLIVDTRYKKLLSHFGEYQEKFWDEIVAHCETQFQCERCPTTWMLPKDFESHYENAHPDVKVREVCVFCDGRYKGKDANHLTKCFKLKEQQQPPPEKSFPLSMDLTPQCPSRDMFGREKFVPGYYDDLFLSSEEEEKDCLKFHGNVDLARRYISWFLSNGVRKFWYHIMVRYMVMKQFCEVMESNRSTTSLLRYWCWCDGGDPNQNVQVRHHRHMILVTTDPKFMKREWRELLVSSSHDFNSKKSFLIETVWHLRNVINYLSKRESQCQYGMNYRGLHHYCIGTGLPKIAKLCMATCTPDGISEYLVERFGKMSTLTLMKNAVLNEEGIWQIRASDLFREDEMGCVLPVEKNWRPCNENESSRYFIWLMNGKKLYFEKSEEVVEKEDQAAGGNVFYKIFDDLWTLPPSKQKELNLQMKKINCNLRMEIDQLQEDRVNREKEMLELQDECEKWKREARIVKSKLSKAQQQLTFLKTNEEERKIV